MIEQLKNLLHEGEVLENDAHRERWTFKVEAFLKSALGPDQVNEFSHLTDHNA